MLVNHGMQKQLQEPPTTVSINVSFSPGWKSYARTEHSA